MSVDCFWPVVVSLHATRSVFSPIRHNKPISEILGD